MRFILCTPANRFTRGGETRMAGSEASAGADQGSSWSCGEGSTIRISGKDLRCAGMMAKSLKAKLVEVQVSTGSDPTGNVASLEERRERSLQSSLYAKLVDHDTLKQYEAGDELTSGNDG